MFFSTSIFESAGLVEEEAQKATLGMGTVNVAMTFVSLALIDIAGRQGFLHLNSYRLTGFSSHGRAKLRAVPHRCGAGKHAT